MKNRVAPFLLTILMALLCAMGLGNAMAQEGISLELLLSRDVFDQGDPVMVRFKVTNQTGRDVAVEFGGCQRTPFNLSVYDADANLLWDTADPRCPPCVCTLDFAKIEFPPGEFISGVPLTWNQSQLLTCAPLPPFEDPTCGAPVFAGVGTGTYFLLGRIFNLDVYSDPVEIRIQRF